MSQSDPLRYYDLESYLFEDMRKLFQSNKSIGAFEFLSIVNWKASRARTYVIRRLLTKGPRPFKSLEDATRSLTHSLFHEQSDYERFRIMFEDWGFSLPMMSAVLTVLWPERFSIYDVRPCEQLGAFERLKNWSKTDRVWEGYEEFIKAVQEANPDHKLRDSDRILWATSAIKQLQNEIQHPPL